MTAKYLIVSVNEEDEHEIIYVSSDKIQIEKIKMAFVGRGGVYKLEEKIE